MSMQEAIQLNNQAVILLESKLFEDATVSSYAALETFQQYQRQQTPDDQEASHQNSYYSIDHLMSFHDSTSSSDDMENEFIYEHGIALPRDIMDPNIITLVIVFNMALCHQLLAKQCANEDSSRIYLHRARQLYRLTHNLQDGAQIMLSTSVFNFVVGNNLGVIHSKLGNYEEANEYFSHLVSMMMIYSVVFGEKNRLYASIQGFWKNVVRESIAPAA